MISDTFYRTKVLEAGTPELLSLDMDEFFEMNKGISIRNIQYFTFNRLSPVMTNSVQNIDTVYTVIIVYKTAPQFFE